MGGLVPETSHPNPATPNHQAEWTGANIGHQPFYQWLSLGYLSSELDVRGILPFGLSFLVGSLGFLSSHPFHRSPTILLLVLPTLPPIDTEPDFQGS